MVQEYKNTDLDLFQKIDLTNPKDELLKKNKIGSSQQENNNIKFNYLNHEISKFENLESHLSQDKSKNLMIFYSLNLMLTIMLVSKICILIIFLNLN